MEDLKTSLHATPLANVSPNAKKVAERQRTAIHKSDEGGISLLQDYLEIKSFDEDCDGALLYWPVESRTAVESVAQRPYALRQLLKYTRHLSNHGRTIS